MAKSFNVDLLHSKKIQYWWTIEALAREKPFWLCYIMVYWTPSSVIQHIKIKQKYTNELLEYKMG